MHKALKRALFILLIAAALTGFALGGLQLYNRSYVNLNGVSYPRELQVLDLSGKPLKNMERLTRFYDLKQLDLRDTGATIEQFEWLTEHLSGCSILWELPFQNAYLSRSTQSITITSLTLEEVEMLDYLPLLASVDAWDCRDYEALLALQQRRPECKVFFNVPIGDKLFDCDTSDLVLKDLTDTDIARKLGWLPRLRSVRFTGILPPAALLRTLEEAYPEVSFSWNVQVGSESLDCRTRELDLRAIPQNSAGALSDLIRYFPELEILRLGQTELPEEALLALEKGNPGLFIVWDLELAGAYVSRDAQEVNISGQTVADLAALEQRLALMPRLRKVDMSGCGLSSEEMDALNNRYDSIRFIWTVNIGGVELRTDAVSFAPIKHNVNVNDAMLEELRYCVDMVCIDIGHMRGVTHCQWASYMPKLKYLVIADTNIKDLSPLAGLQELVYLEVFMSPVRDYSPLLQCPALEDLNLGYTYGDPTPVIQMTWLKRLWWPGALRVLTWSVRNELKTNLPDAKMNFTAGSSTGEGWRSGQHYYDMRDLIGMGYMTG